MHQLVGLSKSGKSPAPPVYHHPAGKKTNDKILRTLIRNQRVLAEEHTSDVLEEHTPTRRLACYIFPHTRLFEPCTTPKFWKKKNVHPRTQPYGSRERYGYSFCKGCMIYLWTSGRVSKEKGEREFR
ncbi:hypothetical protein CEXT_274051 [Caerostris extrusa]|uniref:Uncharacterized protein n=1 Tax=Caerostris extrusa TaxID=172846 RepID=A0AAV4T2V1_CAEEX|nr:hypothetical protein CEXT_274051 [Caerostris extrusa]